MRKFLLILAIAAVIPVFALTFSSCRKKTYTCVCNDGFTYDISALTKSKATSACEGYGSGCYIE